MGSIRFEHGTAKSIASQALSATAGSLESKGVRRWALQLWSRGGGERDTPVAEARFTDEASVYLGHLSASRLGFLDVAQLVRGRGRKKGDHCTAV